MPLDRVTQELANRIQALEIRTRALETPDSLGPDALGAYLPLAGGTMTGFILLHADPLGAMHAVTKQYVDALGTGAIVIASGVDTTAWEETTVAWHDDPNLAVSINPVATSTVLAWGYMTWRCNNTRAQAVSLRLSLNAVAGWTHGAVGATAYQFVGTTVLGIWTGVAAGAKDCIFQMQPFVAADSIKTWQRQIIAIAIPE